MTDGFLHQVVITAIIVKDGKFLIEQRSLEKDRFPGRWTVPGGKLHVSDYEIFPKDTTDYWYNVLERTLAREVNEEVGIEIKNIRYLTSLATIHKDGAPSLVISCLADYSSGDIRLQEEEVADFKWVSLEEARQYDLIDGIFEELRIADKFLKTGELEVWGVPSNQSSASGAEG